MLNPGTASDVRRKDDEMTKSRRLIPGVTCLCALVLAAGAADAQPDGSIVGWGRKVVVKQSALVNLVSVAAGGGCSLGIRANGTIVAWGAQNEFGQCNVPAPNADFVAVATGGSHSLGLKSDGTVLAWGSNYNGECIIPAPNAGFAAISAGAGGGHSLGLKSSGAVVGWGNNSRGQCNVPAPNADFVAIAAGETHSLGLQSDGTIVAWGNNSDGQCDIPAPNADFVAIAAGGRTAWDSSPTVPSWPGGATVMVSAISPRPTRIS